LFVIVGSVIGVGTIVWLGAAKFFEGGNSYVAYFDESVQGLNPDSNVKLRGVNVGRVERISVEPASAMVEVVMKLNVKERLGGDICAELKSAGLTGIVFIDLDRKKDGETLDVTPPGCNPSYPLIPSRPSRTKQILAGIDTLINRVGSAKTGMIFNNLESATLHLDRTFRRTDRLLAEGKVDHILNSTKETIAEARSTLKGIKTEFDSLKLREASGQTQRILVGLEKDSRRISADLKMTVENLRQVSENLEVLVDRIQADPSEILFSSAPSPRLRREKGP
jgi:phospholipid/cholesterol/gamma-HCH transport system substrate-binding protein